MAKKTARQNEIDRITKLAATLGMDIDALLEEVPQTEIGADAAIRHNLEAESVLFYVETRGKGFSAKKCQRCDNHFLFSYHKVKYCSEECRAWALADLGIIWNFARQSDAARWNVKGKGLVPKIIGPSATAALIESGNMFTELPEQRDSDE
jgi:hypothetical protein